MNFPKEVNFKLVDQLSTQPVRNLAVLLRLHAHRKNDYYVGPILSDDKGLAVFTQNSCLKEIENSQNFFIMDYDSNLEECLPKVTLEIMKVERLQLAMDQIKKYGEFYGKYWDCSESFLNRLENTDNDLYLSDSFIFEEAQLHQAGPIVIEVRRKPD